MNSITTLIDADSMLYALAYGARENEDIDLLLYNTDVFVKTILDNTNCGFYLGFLGGSKCFRHTLTEDYKANRPSSPDWFKKWGPLVKHRLIDKWNFTICDGIEAEDAMSIANYQLEGKTNIVLAHIDKDSNCIPGNHYNYSKHEFWYTDKLGKLELNKSKLKGTGLKWQYSQLICGDSTDGIKGIKGKGGAFAYKLLNSCVNEYSLFRRTYCAYLEYCKEGDIKEYFKLQWGLVVMLTEEAHGFVVPERNTYTKEVEAPNEIINDILGI